MYKAKNILLSFLFVYFHWTGHARSQDAKDTVVEMKIAQLTDVWKKYNALSSREFSFTNMKVVSDFMDRSFTLNDTGYYNYLLAYRNASINSVKDDYGLKLSANVSDNFGSPVIADDDLVYRFRAQTGLDWDIMKDGYYSMKVRVTKLENEYLINKLEHNQQTRSDLFVEKYARILFLYNTQKIKILEDRRIINGQKLELAKQLNTLKEIPYSEVLTVDQSITDIDGMFMVYKSYNDLVKEKIKPEEIPTEPFPLVDIDFQKLAANVSKMETFRQDQDSIINLKIRNLELETDPRRNITLRASLKYNYYFVDPTIGSRDFFSLGVGFSMPIPSGKKNDLKVVDAERQLLQYESKGKTNEDAYEELLNSLYEYRYKLKQYMNFNEKRTRFRELLRVERVKEQFGDEEFNPLSALNLLDELLAVNVEMLDLQQQMYLQLLRISNKYPGMKMSDCIKPFSIDLTGSQEKKMNTSIYAWSSVFEDYSNSYIAEYMILNHFSNAIVSVRKNGPNTSRTTALFDTLSRYGLSCELMTGNIKMLKADVNRILDSLIAGVVLKNIWGIHLDIEPHALKDYKNKEQQYQQSYIKMLKTAATYCSSKGLKLAVSIPLFYPEETLKEIYATCDRVYLMAYEKPDVDFIEKKTAEEFKFGKDKTIISLRADDFATRHDMEVFVGKLSDRLKIDRFAYHDLGRMIDLDQGQVKNVNKED